MSQRLDLEIQCCGHAAASCKDACLSAHNPKLHMELFKTDTQDHGGLKRKYIE